MRLPGRKALIITGVAALVILLPFILIPLLVDPGKVAEQFKAAVKQQAGLDIVIEGSGSARLGSGVTVAFRSLRIPAPQGSYSPDLLTAERAVFHIGLFSALFTDDPKIFAAELVRPAVTTEMTEAGKQNWNAQANGLRGTLVALLKSLSFEKNLERLIVTNGTLQLSDIAHKSVIKIEALSFTTDYTPTGSQTAAKFNFETKPYALNLHVEGGDIFSVDGVLTQGSSSAAFKGALEAAKATGALTVKTDNLWPWLEYFYGLKPREMESAPMPFSMAGPIEISDREIVSKQVALEQGNSKGEITARLVQGENGDWAASAKLDFSSLELEAALKLYHAYCDHEKASTKLQPGEPLDLLPDHLLAAMDITIGSASFLGRTVSDARAKAELRASQIVLDSFSFATPGAGKFVGAGVITERPDGLAVDSGLDAEGESLRTLAMEWKLIKDLPKNLYENFRARFRAFLSTSETRFYEARLKAGETDIGGAVIFYPGTALKITAALGIKAIDLDALYRTLFPTRNASFGGEGKANIQVPDFAWLKTIPYLFNGNFRIDDFTLAGKAGKSAVLQLSLLPGKLSLSDLSAEYDEMSMAGSIQLNAAPERPEFSVEMVTDKINFRQLLTLTGYDPAYETLAFPYLQAFSGNAKLKASEFALGAWPIQDAAIEFSLNENALTIPAMSGKVWGGGMTATGALGTGTIPTFALSVSLNSFTLADAMMLIGGWRNYDGRASASVDLNTSGLTLADWWRALAGNISLSARGVTVDGFDLEALVAAAAKVRTVADIQKVTNADLLTGSTGFSEVSGNFPIQGGVIRPEATKLLSPFSQGKLGGSYSLLSKEADLSAQFPLTSLAPTDYPTLGIVIKGPGTEPKLTIDTRSLEAYVARRSAQEMLDKR